MKSYNCIIDAEHFSRYEKYNIYARVNYELQKGEIFQFVILEDVRRFFALDSVYLDEIFQVKEEELIELTRKEGALFGYINECEINASGDCCYSYNIIEPGELDTALVSSTFRIMREKILESAKSAIPEGMRGSLLAGVINQIKQAYAPNLYAFDGSFAFKVYVSTKETIRKGEDVTLKFVKEKREIVPFYRGNEIGYIYPVPARSILFLLDDNLQIKGRVVDFFKTGVNILIDVQPAEVIENARKEIKEYQSKK